MKLYDAVGNSNSRKIRALAKELDLPLDVIPVDMRAGDHKKPEFLKINPNGKVPAFVDGDLKLFESNAILCYLATKSGRPTPLLPSDAKGRAHVDQWLFWQTAHLAPAMGKIAFERFYKANLNLGAPDQAKIDEGLTELDRFCTVLDGWLSSREYVCGQITVADFALAATLSRREAMQVDVSKWKNLTSWLQRVESRPAWVHAEQ